MTRAGPENPDRDAADEPISTMPAQQHESDFDHEPSAPPPPVGVGLYQRSGSGLGPIGSQPRPAPEPEAKPEPKKIQLKRSTEDRVIECVGRPFDAELDISELDDRDRPGPAWTARSQQLSRSTLIFISRRMCYAERMLIVAVHLIDAEPVPLFGRIVACEYEGEAQYRVEVELQPVPESRPLVSWIEDQSRTTPKRP